MPDFLVYSMPGFVLFKNYGTQVISILGFVSLIIELGKQYLPNFFLRRFCCGECEIQVVGSLSGRFFVKTDNFVFCVRDFDFRGNKTSRKKVILRCLKQMRNAGVMSIKILFKT